MWAIADQRSLLGEGEALLKFHVNIDVFVNVFLSLPSESSNPQLSLYFLLFFFQAIKSFSTAVHLYPADDELWTEDLLWALDLLKKKETIQTALKTEIQKENRVQITELNSDTETNVDELQRQPTNVKAASVLGESKRSQQQQSEVRLDNYVKMRDY